MANNTTTFTAKIEADTSQAEKSVDNFTGAVENSISGLKNLKKQLKETAAGSEDFKRISGQIRDVEDALEGAKLQADDFAGALEGAPGIVGQLAGGFKKVEIATKSWGAAIKATGVGLLVSAVGMLVAAFSQTEGSLKKLEPVLIGVEKIFGGLVEAMQPVLDIILDLAMKALPYVVTGVKTFYGSLAALFTLVKEAGAGVGTVLKGLFTLDSDLISKGYDQIKGSVGEAGKSFDEFTANFDKGYKKRTATQKKNDEDAAAAREKALQANLKHLEAQDKLDASQLAKLKAEALALADTEQKKLEVEEKYYKKSYEARQKDLLDKQALYDKGSDEYKGYQAELNTLDAERTTTLTGFKDKQTEITKTAQKTQYDAEINGLELKKAQGLIVEEEYQQSLYNLAIKYQQDAQGALIKYEAFKKEQREKSAESAKAIALMEIQDEIDALKIKNDAIEGDYALDQERLAQIKTDLEKQREIELSNTKLTLEQRNAIIKKYAAEEQAIDKEVTASKRAETEARQAINMAYLGLAQQFGNALSQMAGENKKLAIAGVVISQAAAIGQIVAQTAIANAKALVASPLTGGMPWVAINTISAGLSIATTISSAIKSIQQINATPGPSGGGGGSVGGAPSIQAPRVGTAGTPQMAEGVGANPSAQIAQTIGNASNQPIRAYVVSQDITSQQMLDRKSNQAAVF
jgi:hypothetical protein